jgi:starvation-inducible outer membrane lipoprotein
MRVLLLCLLLTACASTPRVVVQEVPDALTEPVAVPVPEGRTNGALARWADELRAALEKANRRLQRLRDL